MFRLTYILSCLLGAATAALTDTSLEKHANSLKLTSSFNPVKDSYWTGYPHHRRTPFAVSPDGKSAYLAYLDASETDVHVQQVDPVTFDAVGATTTVTGAKEAGGLVAHNDGFALLTNEALPSGTSNAPAGSTPVPVLYRYASGKASWKTFLGGPGVHTDFGLAATPDINGDLAFSEAAGLYGAYFVVTAYTGSAAGHFGDSIQYVTENGTLKTIRGASSSWGCSHNTGIAFEAADSVPFASICAEDQGDIWLNTKTQYMDGVKVSNENTTNGGSGEPMGGMSGSYSGLARYIGSDSYIFAWVSRGAKDLTSNDWLGGGNTHSMNRTNNRRVAIARFSDKNTLIGPEASSVIGSADGDSQVNWITEGSADCSNAHVATFDGTNALVTWEEIAQPQCDFIAMGCKGAFTGSFFQLVSEGKKVGAPIKAMDVFVAGDMVTMPSGKICWPYVDMKWTLDGPVYRATKVTSMSFACMSNGGSGSLPVSSVASIASSAPATSSALPTSSPSASSTPVSKSSAVSLVNTGPTISIATLTSANANFPSGVATSLPTFVLVTSSATSTSPTSSALAASTIPSAKSSSSISLNPILPTGAASGTPQASVSTQIPDSCSSFSIPSNKTVTTVTVTAKETVTVTIRGGASNSTTPAQKENVSKSPSGSDKPFPTLPASSAIAPLPSPSGNLGQPSKRPTESHYSRPSGGWAVWPRPTRYSRKPRPTGGRFLA